MSEVDVPDDSLEVVKQSVSKEKRIVQRKIERYSLVIDSVREVRGDKPVDVLCYTPEEFERGSESFLPSIIQEEGISI